MTEAKVEGVCKVGNCAHHGMKLEECNCNDGKHDGKANKPDEMHGDKTISGESPSTMTPDKAKVGK